MTSTKRAPAPDASGHRTVRPGGGTRRVLTGTLAAAAVLAAVAASSAPAGASGVPVEKSKSDSGTRLAAISTPYDYLMNRADYLSNGVCSGTYVVPALSIVVTWLNGANGVVGYGYAEDITYIPSRKHDTLPIYFPAHFTADHVKMEFSDRDNFNAARADDIGFDIAFGGTQISGGGPTVTETLHSWGNSKVTFSPTGANDGVLYGDDATNAHTTISLVKWCKQIIR